MTIIQNVNDSSSQGYELAQSEFGKLSERPQSSKDWVDFFVNSTKENSDVYFCSGVAAFITEKEVASLDMRTFNKELGQLANVAGRYLLDSRMVDRLLNGVVEIPVALRPDYTYDSIFGSGTGKLGRIYMEEIGMHMYLPHCDVYDTENPDKLLCKGDQFDETSCKLSELLTILQTLLDSDKQNSELSDAIERCKEFESGAGTLPGLLRKYGIGVVNLSTNGWHRVNYQNIHAESMFMVLGENNHINVYLEPGPWFKAENNPFDATKKSYDVTDFIKEGLNRAKNKLKQSNKS